MTEVRNTDTTFVKRSHGESGTDRRRQVRECIRVRTFGNETQLYKDQQPL